MYIFEEGSCIVKNETDFLTRMIGKKYTSFSGVLFGASQEKNNDISWVVWRGFFCLNLYAFTGSLY